MRTDAVDAMLYSYSYMREQEQRQQQEAAYRQGYRDASRRMRELEVERQRRALYFLKQKLLGVVLIAISLISAKVTGDATAAVFLAPVGLYTIFTKEMFLVDSYFLEQEEKKGDTENGGSIRENRTADRKRA